MHVRDAPVLDSSYMRIFKSERNSVFSVPPLFISQNKGGLTASNFISKLGKYIKKSHC